MNAPSHVYVQLWSGHYNLMDRNEARLKVVFQGLPTGLQTSFVLGTDEIDWVVEFGDEVHDSTVVIRLIKRVGEYFQRCWISSEKVPARELYLWSRINRGEIEERWYRWEAWRLQTLLKETQKKLDDHLPVLALINREREERVAASLQEVVS